MGKFEKIKLVEEPHVKKNITKFNIGDTVKVFVKIIEEDKTRLQAFEGVVMRRQGSSIRETFTVRKVSFGVGVERVFPVHSPFLEKITVVKPGRVKRAKLYYLRKKVGKGGKIEEIERVEESPIL